MFFLELEENDRYGVEIVDWDSLDINYTVFFICTGVFGASLVRYTI